VHAVLEVDEGAPDGDGNAETVDDAGPSFPNAMCRAAGSRVSSKQTKINFGSNQNKICFVFFSVCFVKPKIKNFGLFQCYKPKSKQPKQTELFRNKLKQTETNGNNPKFSEKYPKILSFKLFGRVFCLFRFNRNIKTLCFSIEAKQPKQTFCFR
jgi:hypothetical protein